MSSNDKNYADTIGVSRISIGDCHKTLLPIMRAGNTPCLHGEAGIGKTEIALQLAYALGVDRKAFAAVMVSQTVSSDFLIPFRDNTAEGQYFRMLMAGWLKPIMEAGERGEPSMIFFDEITRYQDAETASVIFSIISDRTLGGHKLPDNCYILAACNPDNGNYDVNDIINERAWRRRLNHVVVDYDVAGWLRWAKEEGIHEWVTDYVSSNIEMLLDEKACAAGKVYATPASWAKVSNFLQVNDNLLSMPALASYIGYDVASDFIAYTEDSEFKLSPATVLSDWTQTLEVLTRIEEASRGDLVTRLVSSTVMYLYNNKPAVDKAAGPFTKFWAHISAEAKVKLVTELFAGKERDGDTYHKLLMSEVMKSPLWASKILPEVRHCMGRV